MPKFFTKLSILLTCAVTLCAPLMAQEPTDAMKSSVDRIVAIIEQNGAASNLKDLILVEVEKVFDFNEMAKRSLGRSWNDLNESQQNEFTEVFSDFLSKTYIKRVKQIKKDMVSFESERIVGNKALIETVVKDDGETFPIDYKMYKDGKGNWFVYDVVIENIGLVANYRNEFAGILRKESFKGLLAKLKAKNVKLQS